MAEQITYGQKQRELASLFQNKDIETPMLDARLLIQDAFGLSHEQLVLNAHQQLKADGLERLDEMVQARLARKPVSRIFGKRDFYKDQFFISDATLDPRPDSECLIEFLVACYKDKKPKTILDLGTGSGCLLLSLLGEFQGANGVGIDLSFQALQIARENAKNLQLAERASFSCGNWANALKGSFDIIIANPPYIESAALLTLAPEVRLYDPKLALDGGQTGVEPYQIIINQSLALLKEGGWLVLEIGASQEEVIKQILSNELLRIRQNKEFIPDIYEMRDYNDIIRGLALRI